MRATALQHRNPGRRVTGASELPLRATSIPKRDHDSAYPATGHPMPPSPGEGSKSSPRQSVQIRKYSVAAELDPSQRTEGMLRH